MALFNVGRAIGGFAKRGLEHNDEARKNLQDMVKASVATLTTDAIEQRKARKTIKSNYVKTANNLKALKLHMVMPHLLR
jgi:histone H3/H4